MIRSLTVGIPLYSASTSELQSQLAAFKQHAEALGERSQLRPRTIRLSLPPPSPDQFQQTGTLPAIIRGVSELAKAAGARWYCLPIDLFQNANRSTLLQEVLPILSRDTQLFLNLMVADLESISMIGAKEASEFILRASQRSQNGIDCFRVGISAGCPAGAPFFPFSRHQGQHASFSIAMETTRTALAVAQKARKTEQSLHAFQDCLIAALAREMKRVDEFGHQLAKKSGLRYLGLDASYAPFPDGKTSVAHIVEALGPTPVGAHGSVFITSILTSALQRAGERADASLVGFNGVMYSVLEDEGLAHANDLRSLSLAKLALLSTVCGCGIDMVPLPSGMYSEEIAGLILDIATLSLRLHKPLGVRLLPIPNKMVNERTQFNLDFLCDSRVMDSGISASTPMLNDEVWRFANPSHKKTQP